MPKNNSQIIDTSVGSKTKTHHLSIYLIKRQFETEDKIVNIEECDREVNVSIPGCDLARLYIKKTAPNPPTWAALFRNIVDPSYLAVPSVSALLLIKSDASFFALAFGRGRFLLRDEVWEERFGLLCALNSVHENSFRCVDIQSLDAIQSHSRIQSGLETTPEQFGLNVELDMFKAVVGTPLNPALGNKMSGADCLHVSVKANLSDLPYLLEQYRKNFEADLSEERYSWINNMSQVKNSELKLELEAALSQMLQAHQYNNVWLAIPEIVDWTVVCGFTFSRRSSELRSDVTLDCFLSMFKDRSHITLDDFRSNRVFCVDANHNKVFKSWPVFRCLYAEVDKHGAKYVLNDATWYKVSIDFVEKTDTEFLNIPYSSMKLPCYTGHGEGAYNAMVAAEEPANYALLDDTKKVMHGGGYGQVEICDLFSIRGELIHVKRSGKSSVLSHLFAQGFISGQLIQNDPKFRAKVRDRLEPPFEQLINVEKRPSQDELTVVYAVISDQADDQLHLPFFSRVNLNNTRRNLIGLGYKVELLKINIDEQYSKTVSVKPRLR